MAATLVLVDDEPALLRLMQMYLTKLGYNVSGHRDGTSAEQVFADGSVDLLIVDLTLPDISGDALGLKLARAHPNLRVLVCSGYPFDARSLPEDVRDRFMSLQKPFVPRMLAQCIEELLNQPRSA